MRHYPSPLVDYLRRHGRTRVMFRANYPMITPATALDGIDALNLGDEAKALFLGANAQRVFGL